MIKVMTINDYEELFELWQNTANMGLRSLDDSKEGISCFLKRCGHDGRRGYMYHTVVLPDYRRRGIASSLVESAIAALQKEGITRVCLNVMETNEQGKKFWISKGWEKKDFLGFYSKSITDKENLPLFEI